MTDQRLQPSIKVWQPRGFEGLEVEHIRHVEVDIPTLIVNTYEFSLLAKGQGELVYNEKKERVSPDKAGSVLAVQSPGTTVSARSDHQTPMTIYTLRFDEAWLRSQFDDDRPTPAFPETLVGNARVNEYLSLLAWKGYYSFAVNTSALERHSRLLDLVVETIDFCGDINVTRRRFGLEHQAVKQTQDYLKEHFSQDVSLDNIATLTGLNKYHLLEVFKRDVGVSPHVYQTSLRVHKAKRLLAKGSPIASVATDTGFADQAHLTRVFKRYVLVTPGQFQKDSLKG